MIAQADFDIMPYQILNLDKVQNSFTAWLPSTRDELLRDLLGYDFSTLFIAQLDEDPVPAIWATLDAGGTYQLDGKTYQWCGMSKLLKPALYCLWIQHNWGNLGGSGIELPEVENGKAVNPAMWAAGAWSKYRTLAGSVYDKKNTLYGFLADKGAEYPDYMFTKPSIKNAFGI